MRYITNINSIMRSIIYSVNKNNYEGGIDIKSIEQLTFLCNCMLDKFKERDDVFKEKNRPSIFEQVACFMVYFSIMGVHSQLTRKRKSQIAIDAALELLIDKFVDLDLIDDVNTDELIDEFERERLINELSVSTHKEKYIIKYAEELQQIFEKYINSNKNNRKTI